MWKSRIEFGSKDYTHTATKEFRTMQEAIDETNKEVEKTRQENLYVDAEIEYGGGGEI